MDRCDKIFIRYKKKKICAHFKDRFITYNRNKGKKKRTGGTKGPVYHESEFGESFSYFLQRCREGTELEVLRHINNPMHFNLISDTAWHVFFATYLSSKSPSRFTNPLIFLLNEGTFIRH